MARGPSTFKQRDVTAACKAVIAAGFEVARVKVGKDGSIEIATGKAETISEKPEINGSDNNPWNTVA